MRTLRTFRLAGFNRHGDLPVFELWMTVDADEIAVLERGSWRGAFDGLVEALAGRACVPEETGGPGNDDVIEHCARRLAAVAIGLQRVAGFRVSHGGALAGTDAASIRFFAEYDLEEAGMAAIDLAVDLLAEALASHGADATCPGSLHARFQSLCEQARTRATPAHTRALIDEARRRGIPFFRMDREPYDPVRGAFRLSADGLLRLGQACHQRTVDGSFCVERSEKLHGLARDRSAMFNRLQRMAFALPLAAGGELRQCSSPRRAARAARRVGFPVVLKSVRRRPGDVVTGLSDESAVVEAATDLCVAGPVFVEPSISGEVVELLFVGQQRFAALRRSADGGTRPAAFDCVPARDLSAIERLAGELELMCLSVAVVPGSGGDSARTLVLDVDPAPRLDALLGEHPGLVAEAAGRMLEWLFPRGHAARIPVAAITGTNGKTTTAFLLERILRRAGYRTGLACSTGTYIGGEAVDQFEDGYLPGHLTALDNPEVTAGILETTRGGVMSTGIGFDRCDVAACLNVGYDHLDDQLGIRSLDELAQLKQWIVERGTRPVLNADDPYCRAMAEALADRRPVLVSRTASGAERSPDAEATVCIIETVDTRDWIVLRDGPRRIPLIAVDEVSVTFGGRAGHNVSNALHAAAMAHVLGADQPAIAAGLASVRPESGDMPARLNLHRCDGVDILIDYAHNPDGLARLVDFCGRLDVGGRRILAVSLPPDRGDAFITAGMGKVAGHFDHFVCKNYRIDYGREPHELPRLLLAALEQAGVPPQSVTRIEDEDEAIAYTLDMARPGDLIVLVVGKYYRETIQRVERFIETRRGSTSP